jgi:hypothetical protein
MRWAIDPGEWPVYAWRILQGVDGGLRFLFHCFYSLSSKLALTLIFVQKSWIRETNISYI